MNVLLPLLVATSVLDILQMPREELAQKPEIAVTGVVSCVFRWQENSCILVSPDDVDGAAVYVGGMMPSQSRAVMRGASSLRIGDQVIVRGNAVPMMLEPGIRAVEIEVISHRELPPARVSPPIAVMRGRRNNRRVVIEGVFWNSWKTAGGGEEMTSFRVGTPDGPLTFNFAPEYKDIAKLRNRRVRVEGVALPLFNARSEFLTAEIETIRLEPLGEEDEAPPAVDITGATRGVLAYGTVGLEGCLLRVRGEVVFRDSELRYCIVRPRAPKDGAQPLSIRVDAAKGVVLPDVGSVVSAEGFPARLGDLGCLEEGYFEPSDDGGEPVSPKVLDGELLQSLLQQRGSLSEDCSYRFVRVRGRIESASRPRPLADDYEFSVSTPYGRFVAILHEEPEFDLGQFVDRPLVDLTGVLDARRARNSEYGRILAADICALRLRSSADIAFVPDAETRWRKAGRYLRQLLLLSIVPLVGVIVLALVANWRRRVLTAAISADRKRIAEELHDTVAQQLAGARMMIFSARSNDAVPADLRDNLSLALEALETARREVRDSVFRLKNDDLVLKTTETLIREGAEKVAARCGVKFVTNLCAFPDWVTGEVKQDVLTIIREAVTNAVKHGPARVIEIDAARIGSDGLGISVLNDGAVFDAQKVLGSESGHFGLSGMHERAARSGFSLSFRESKGRMEVRLERQGR